MSTESDWNRIIAITVAKGDQGKAFLRAQLSALTLDEIRGLVGNVFECDFTNIDPKIIRASLGSHLCDEITRRYGALKNGEVRAEDVLRPTGLDQSDEW